jgi:hypothetical protein
MENNYIISKLVCPEPVLILSLLLLMLIDLFTGVNKTTKLKKATTAKGLRATFEKGSIYLLFITSLTVIIDFTNVADANKELSNILKLSLSGSMMVTCYIEFKSIIENLLVINTNKDGNLTSFGVYFLNPIRNILIIKFSKKTKQIKKVP